MNLAQSTRALGLLAVGLVMGRLSAPRTSTVVRLAGAPLEAWSSTAVGDPSIYDDAENVTPGKPSPAGEGSFRFEDARGAYERREFPIATAAGAAGVAGRERAGGRHEDDGVVVSSSASRTLYVNVLFTRAGHFRSGDIHRCHQVNQIVAGRARVTMVHAGKQKAGGRGWWSWWRWWGPQGDDGHAEAVTELVTGDQIVISPHVPHLFEFVEDTLMTESWVHGENRTQCAFQAWFYQPLRRRIPEETQRSVFVTASPSSPSSSS